MSCCFSNVNGLPATGGGGGITIPGSVMWTFANDGGPADGIIVTTDATPVFRTWGNLFGASDAVNGFGCLYAQEQTTGNRAAFRFQIVGVAQNGVGVGSGEPYPFIGGSGYDESASGLAPWNTGFTFPAGMAGGINYLPGGGLVQVAFNGLAGVTFHWKCWIIATPFFNATIQV